MLECAKWHLLLALPFRIHWLFFGQLHRLKGYFRSEILASFSEFRAEQRWILDLESGRHLFAVAPPFSWAVPFSWI
jgi:hypothetical protein